MITDRPSASLEAARRDGGGIVVIAASLGGIEALRGLLPQIPSGFPDPILVVQHRALDNRDVLVDVLRPRCALPLRAVADGGAPEPGTIYVAPARAAVHVERHAFHVVEMNEPRSGCPDQADVAMASAADAFGSRAVGVVLTGLLHDGSSGVAAIKRAGGIVLAEDPLEAVAPAMPLAAIRTGAVDHVLPLGVISRALVTLVMSPWADVLLRRPPWPRERGARKTADVG